MKDKRNEAIIKGIEAVIEGLNQIVDTLRNEGVAEAPKAVAKKESVEETSEEVPVITGKFDKEELASMKYNEFKKLAASLGVKCTGTRDEIMERILALDVTVSKEYDFVTFENIYVEKPELNRSFKLEEFEATNYGKVVAKRCRTDKMNEPDALYFDSKKLPKTAKWRYREDGDIFQKFGGGTKKLKSFLCSVKYPA